MENYYCDTCLKKGTCNKTDNYQPISSTCILYKVLESIVRDVIVDYMKANDLLTNCQNGFSSKRSFNTQLLEVIEDFTIAIENNQPVDMIFGDFKKA